MLRQVLVQAGGAGLLTFWPNGKIMYIPANKSHGFDEEEVFSEWGAFMCQRGATSEEA